MILPTKRLGADRALLAIGGEIIRILDKPKTVSRIWDEHKRFTATQAKRHVTTYDWFVLALDLLYAIGAVKYENGLIQRTTQ